MFIDIQSTHRTFLSWLIRIIYRFVFGHQTYRKMSARIPVHNILLVSTFCFCNNHCIYDNRGCSYDNLVELVAGRCFICSSRFTAASQIITLHMSKKINMMYKSLQNIQTLRMIHFEDNHLICLMPKNKYIDNTY